MALSVRSTKQPPNLTAKATADAWRDLYSPTQNPNGVINLGVAENSLMQDILVQEFKQNFSRLEPSFLNYQSLGGSSSFKKSICYILNKYFNPTIPVQPEHLISASGVTAVIAQLMYAICDQDDGVLISKPYYSGFNHLAKQGIHLLGFEIEDPLDPQSVSKSLETAYLEHHLFPHRIKSVILCNPHNPMGYYVGEEVLEAYLKFCEAKDLHLIVDEIYGLSVFAEGALDTTDHEIHPLQTVPNKFISSLSLDHHRNSFDTRKLHVLYGISKDFGCCGLRAGVLISQNNPELLKTITNLNLNQVQVSSLTECSFSNLILNDHDNNQVDSDFIDYYILENKRRLSKAHLTVVEKLESLRINYNKPTNAGFFLMIDLSRFLERPEDDLEPTMITNQEKTENLLQEKKNLWNQEEDTLFKRLLIDYKIYLAPGNAFNYPMPGFFRLTFTVPLEQLDLGLTRLSQFIQDFESICSPLTDLHLSPNKT